MRGTSLGCRAPVVVAALCLALGCQRLTFGTTSTPPDAGSGGASPSETASSWAANAGDVARFADETPFGPDAIVARDNTPVRKAPANRDVIVTLPAGTDVVKLAAHGDDDLVCFDEPDGGAHLMGWVAQSALTDPTPPAPAPAPPEPWFADAGPTPPAPSPTNPQPEPPGGHHRHRPHGPPRH